MIEPEMSAASVPLWRPPPTRPAHVGLVDFQDFLARRGLSLDTYQDLWEWSTTDLEAFWAAVWDFFGLDQVTSYDEVLAEI